MKALTERQEQILEFIRQKQEAHGITPTRREIAAHFRFHSPNAAQAHVQALLAKGVLKNLPGRARSMVASRLGAEALIPRPLDCSARRTM